MKPTQHNQIRFLPPFPIQSIFTFATTFTIMSTLCGCRVVGPPNVPGYRPSDPSELAWLQGCSEIVVGVSPPFVAPPDGELEPPGKKFSEEYNAILIACETHRARLQEIVGRTVAAHLQRVLPDKKVHYCALDYTDPFGSFPSGLTPAKTALCTINFEVVVHCDLPYVVVERGPTVYPMPEHWPDIPSNAITPADRRFMESQKSWLNRESKNIMYGIRKLRGTPAPEFRARMEEYRNSHHAWRDSGWTARPADRSIYTLEAAPSESDSPVQFDWLHLRLRDVKQMQINWLHLESAVSKWADLRARDVAEQVSQALALSAGRLPETVPQKDSRIGEQKGN